MSEPFDPYAEPEPHAKCWVWEVRNSPSVWAGSHEGPCKATTPHGVGSRSLRDVLHDIEACTGELRWTIHFYEERGEYQGGLSGWKDA